MNLNQMANNFHFTLLSSCEAPEEMLFDVSILRCAKVLTNKKQTPKVLFDMLGYADLHVVSQRLE